MRKRTRVSNGEAGVVSSETATRMLVAQRATALKPPARSPALARAAIPPWVTGRPRSPGRPAGWPLPAASRRPARLR